MGNYRDSEDKHYLVFNTGMEDWMKNRELARVLLRENLIRCRKLLTSNELVVFAEEERIREICQELLARSHDSDPPALLLPNFTTKEKLQAASAVNANMDTVAPRPPVEKIYVARAG